MYSFSHRRRDNGPYRPTTYRTASDYSNYSTVSDSSQYSDAYYDGQQTYHISVSSQPSAQPKNASSEWSTWIWSNEHERYYRYRNLTGDMEYEWGPNSNDNLEVDTEKSNIPASNQISSFQSAENQPTQSISSGHVYNMHWLDGNIRGGNTDRKETWVRGTIRGVEVFAFPDSCSSLNIISWTFASRFTTVPSSGTRQQAINLPTGGKVHSMGTVTLPFRFEGEEQAHNITFSVLERCVRNVVLGSGFLSSTRTLTKYKHRIQRGIIGASHIPRICLTDNVSHTVTVSINGHTIQASPDSGSDAMLMSENFANEHGFSIDRSYNGRATLECIDGSPISTCGVVSGVELKFGPSYGDTVRNRTQRMGPKRGHANPKEWYSRDASADDTFICSFYVVANLICPVILSADFLYDTNAFEACERFFNRADDSSGSIGPSMMFVAKGNPPPLGNYNRTVSEIQNGEVILRGEADDWIEDLRCNAYYARADTDAEAERRFRQRWDQWFSTERANPQPGGIPRVSVPQRTWSIEN